MRCSACGRGIEDDSLFCRLCGTRQGDPAIDSAGGQSRVGVWIGGTIVAVLMVAAIAGTRPRDTTPVSAPPQTNDAESAAQPPATLANLTAPAPAATETAPAQTGPWEYAQDEDKVRAATTYRASTDSTNSVNLAPPYDGGSTLRMTVRKHPEWGTDVILRLSSGQLLCRSYDGCYATVRFDDRPARRFTLSESSDNSSDTVFVADAETFIAALKHAKRAVIELEIYEAGRPQFEFDVAGLDWKH